MIETVYFTNIDTNIQKICEFLLLLTHTPLKYMLQNTRDNVPQTETAISMYTSVQGKEISKLQYPHS